METRGIPRRCQYPGGVPGDLSYCHYVGRRVTRIPGSTHGARSRHSSSSGSTSATIASTGLSATVPACTTPPMVAAPRPDKTRREETDRGESRVTHFELPTPGTMSSTCPLRLFRGEARYPDFSQVARSLAQAGGKVKGPLAGSSQPQIARTRT